MSSDSSRHLPRRQRVALCVAALIWIPLAAAPEAAPSLPGAVTKPPEWLGTSVPFDAQKFFAAPPPSQNAAPLYLDALMEFGPEMVDCFPDGPERTRRKVAADDRMKRWREIDEAFKKDPKSVRAEQVDALLNEYEPGWRKLAEAQKRPKCVFQTGISLNTPIPHAQAARQVVRVAELRARRALEKNDPESAIEDLRLVLRLSRDLRPRGYPITQLISVAIDLVCYKSIVGPMLADSRFGPRTAAKLLNVLLEHDRSAIEPFAEAAKADYFPVRGLMHDAVKRGPQLARELGGAPGDSLFGTVGQLLPGQPLGPQTATLPANDPKFFEMDTRVARMSPAALRKDVDLVNEYYRALLALASKRPAERQKALPDPRQMDSKDDLSKLVLFANQDYESLNRTFGRSLALLRGTECLVALRRWQVVEKTPPTDLLAVCKAIGLPAVPVDPHSGGPMKMAIVDGKPVIYSIGIDGKDDGGLVDSKYETQPGDILFRLGP